MLIPAENGEAKVMASAGTGAFAGNLPFANLRGDVSGGDRPSGDFAGGDLPSGDFTGGDVPGADFTGGDLVVTEADLRRLLTGPQPTKLSAGPYPDADNSMLSRASQAGLLFAVAVPLELPVAEYGLASARGLVVFLSRHRALFIEDDARLLGELGAQAAIMAERGSALAEQERLADELAESVTSLQAASQAKTDFLANMSHELRTPLNAIIGFSELMRTEPEAADDRRVVPVEWIDHIFASGQHLLGLINDILDLAKIEAGRMDLRPELVDLPAVVSDVVTTLHPLVDAKHLRLATAIPPITVRADRVRLRQILDNLLSNAIKFTPEEGHIFVGASDIGPDVRITVADTGPGIAPADHERIFDEFQQVGDPMKHQAGTGLGLALTRRLIQAHGGAIGLESDLGHGSRFTVHLPNLAPREDATLLADEPGSKILLIEDEPSSARLLQTYLETTGYSVVVAHSGEEGVAEAQRCAPAAVLLDVLLPGIDGWEVLRRFKDDPMLRSVPVFMVTVVDEREVGLALGAADYFVKPIDRRLLLSRLAELLMPAAPAGEVTAVLAVDEDPRSLDLIASSLRHHGFDVSTAATGEQGLTLARTHSFDLIITDLMMSDTDGFTLIDALDQHPATREIPVLVLTSRNPAEFAEAEFAVAPHGKVLGILPKGLDIQEALREWLTIRLAPEAETVGEVKGDR